MRTTLRIHTLAIETLKGKDTAGKDELTRGAKITIRNELAKLIAPCSPEPRG